MPTLSRLSLRASCLAVPVLAVFLLPAVTLAQSDSPTDPGADVAQVSEVVGDALESEDPGSVSELEASDQSELPVTLSKQIDNAFGTYVVGPTAAVIFYGFGSETWLGTKIPFVVVWLLFGAIFLTLKMGFINFRAFRHAIDLTRGAYDNPDEPGEVSHFQALAAALSATVGLGNIAGVAIAIGTGGPGATLWIIMIGFLGMTSKFAECTLGQLYRVTDTDGHVLGGPMRYLRTGLADVGYAGLGRILAVVFMLLCIGASFGGGNAFQIGQSLEAIRGDIPILQTHPVVYGLLMAFLVGIVIVGGIKSIGAVAGKVVPFMCLAYVMAALYILAKNYAAVPSAVVLIVTEAFTPQAAYGGFLGVLVIGIKRAVFSNEAGVGSAAIVHSAAKTDEPVSEGIVALLEPFIDTVVVCTITALVVVVTGAYNAPELGAAIEADQGAKITLYAFANGGHAWFRYILYFAVVLFAYSTCISWSYYGERCWVELFGERTSVIYKLLFLLFTVLGSVITRGNILDFSDLMILGMSFPNLLGVFLLSGVVKRQLDSYWKRYKSGEIKRVDVPKS
ncbi:alanine/glycine:cation symporter family protein [Rubripirellula reticaptiva]|uniref:Amino-acid carrier protein AlsT n=1 Tax=Rubripirellula reticaptiva TaxID=2528013 RepID=A0A5C6F9T5_9BACT|nr:sodium:alanine symporter family protein [Rubripirellula reticaptiva]TWU57217.1 Amino-acid carrier protein AlsT [Rubripirellula reticaptiva]